MEAFRADALDVGSVADIPPIHATWTGLNVKIVAAKYRQDPINHPIYELGIAPGAGVEDARGPPGQEDRLQPRPGPGRAGAAGAAEGRADPGRRQAGRAAEHRRRLRQRARQPQVDVAPIGGVQIKRYLAKYGKDGGTTHRARPPRRPRPPLRPAELARGPGQGGGDPRVRPALGGRAALDRRAPEGVDRGLLRQGPGTRAPRTASGSSTTPATPRSRRTGASHIAEHQETIDLLAKETGHPKLEGRDPVRPAVRDDRRRRRFAAAGGAAVTTLAAPPASDRRSPANRSRSTTARTPGGSARAAHGGSARRSARSLLLALWSTGSATGLLDPRTLSAPWTVVTTAGELIADGRLQENLLVSHPARGARPGLRTSPAAWCWRSSPGSAAWARR